MDKLQANKVVVIVFTLVVFPFMFYLIMPTYLQVVFIVVWGAIITVMLGGIVAYLLVDIRNKALIYPNENGYLPTIRRGRTFIDLNAVGAIYSGGPVSYDQERQAMLHYLTRPGGTQPREILERAFAPKQEQRGIPVITGPGSSMVIDAVAEEL